MDGYLGFAPILNGGQYLESLKQNYQTRNPAFSISGTTPRQYSILGGFNIQFGRSLNLGSVKFISAGIAVNWLSRKLVHDIQFVNDSLRYHNKISIAESLDAQYLGTEFQLRFGSKFYGILGFRYDFLLGGFREKKLRVESDSVQGGQPIESIEKWQLKSSEFVNQNPTGWHVAVGYSPLPFWGLRLGFIQSGSFFGKEPDFSSTYIYSAVYLSLVK